MTKPIAAQQQALLSVAEDWDKQADLRFDLLVEKEALGELSLEEATELEQLSVKHDRILARFSEEELLQERMCNEALAELQDQLLAKGKYIEELEKQLEPNVIEEIRQALEQEQA